MQNKLRRNVGQKAAEADSFNIILLLRLYLHENFFKAVIVDFFCLPPCKRL